MEAAKDLLGSHGADGVFCVTDLLALGFLDGARGMGQRIPEDLSVIGFDDIPQSAWVPYRLTTVRQSMSDLTGSVLAAIEREMHGQGMAFVHEVLPVELVERATVRPST
jgi:DNA-binding LacI/PurR family transcriptional regulator